MVLEGVNGSFGGIGSMFFGRHTLKVDFIFFKRTFEFLTDAFIIKKVKIRSMACLNKPCVDRFPSIADTWMVLVLALVLVS